MTPPRRKPLTGGVICALVTPFGADEKPDIGALDAPIERQIEAGVHGLFVSGTSGEGPMMTRDERRLVTEGVVEKAAGRIPVVVHCGAADTRTTEHLARHAEAVGADAVAVVAPYFYRFGSDKLYAHFRDVAEATPDIVHYVYENPERVGYSLGPDLVGRLATDVPNIVGVKDTGDSIARLTMYLSLFDDALDVYTGNNALVYPALKIGAIGAVSALANVVPELFVAIYDAARRDDDESALRLQKVAARLQSCFAGLPYVPSIKHLLARAGLDTGHHRRPHAAPSDEQVRRLEDAVRAAEGLEEWLDAAAG